MDYYKLGQRIRQYRKQNGLSQEELAEKINISTTHMSHIETGSTKLSLPVLVDIATVLQVSTDVLLRNSIPSASVLTDEIMHILKTCSPHQLQVLSSILKSTKSAIDPYID